MQEILLNGNQIFRLANNFWQACPSRLLKQALVSELGCLAPCPVDDSYCWLQRTHWSSELLPSRANVENKIIQVLKDKFRRLSFHIIEYNLFLLPTQPGAVQNNHEKHMTPPAPSCPSHLQLSRLASEICVCWIIFWFWKCITITCFNVCGGWKLPIWGVCECSLIRRQRLANLTWFFWMNSRRLSSSWQKMT